MVDKSNGTVISSLFLRIAAYFGSNVSAAVILPMRTRKELNSLVRATNERLPPDCPENWCESHAWRYLSPLKDTEDEAPSGNCIACGLSAWCAIVTMGMGMLESPPLPVAFSSMLSVPSGLCCADLRTAKQKGFGR